MSRGKRQKLVTVRLSGREFAMLAALAAHEDCASVATCLRRLGLAKAQQVLRVRGALEASKR